jgi:hypothetical protein
VTGPTDRCIASQTGNPNITIQLIASYALEIYQFLTTSVDYTSIKAFFSNQFNLKSLRQSLLARVNDQQMLQCISHGTALRI